VFVNFSEIEVKPMKVKLHFTEKISKPGDFARGGIGMSWIHRVEEKSKQDYR